MGAGLEGSPFLVGGSGSVAGGGWDAKGKMFHVKRGGMWLKNCALCRGMHGKGCPVGPVDAIVRAPEGRIWILAPASRDSAQGIPPARGK